MVGVSKCSCHDCHNLEIIEPLTSKMAKKHVNSEADKKRMANAQAKKRELAKKRKIAASKIELAAKYS